MDTSGGTPRYVVGVNGGLHDAAAALLRDGELVAMVEQERLSRRRHAFFESPSRAIAACLGEAGIGLDAVREIAVGWDIPALLESEEDQRFDRDEFSAWLLGDLAGELPGGAPPLRFVDHHMAHAASAFYTSGFADAAILVVDGRGESVATTVAVGGPGGIEPIETWGANQSLGLLYGAAAEWAGLRMRGTGKLMGLAAYGKDCQRIPLEICGNGYAIAGAPSDRLPVSQQLGRLRDELRRSFASGYPFGPGDPAEVMAHANFAASAQGALERVLLHLAATARRETGCTRLAMAGGVALNCTANGAIIRSDIFDEVWIPPFPYDAGVSLGAALVAERALYPAAAVPARLPHAFWAPTDDDADRDAALAALSGCELTQHDGPQLAEVVAEHLIAGRLIGWYQGRAEIGQRALGARSILCDPRRREALVHANRVKGREPWRPLAPAVLAGSADELFEGSLTAAADFMLAAWQVREQAQARMPAAVHVDGSARPQRVAESQSPYHDTIAAFHERSGVPAVINTSFNLAGEPVVHSARDAVDTFLRSDLDVLVLDDLVAVKTSKRSPDAQGAAPGKMQGNPDLSFAVPWAGALTRS